MRPWRELQGQVTESAGPTVLVEHDDLGQLNAALDRLRAAGALIAEVRRVRQDLEASFEAAGLTEEERDLIRRRDWRGLMHYGAIFFVLEKLGAVTGVSNRHSASTSSGSASRVSARLTAPVRSCLDSAGRW